MLQIMQDGGRHNRLQLHLATIIFNRKSSHRWRLTERAHQAEQGMHKADQMQTSSHSGGH